jgi:hypothetical protein
VIVAITDFYDGHITVIFRKFTDFDFDLLVGNATGRPSQEPRSEAFEPGVEQSLDHAIDLNPILGQPHLHPAIGVDRPPITGGDLMRSLQPFGRRERLQRLKIIEP